MADPPSNNPEKSPESRAREAAEAEAERLEAERRAADRAAITLRVDYKRLNTFFADYTKNISKGGTFIRTTKPLDVGTEFVFVLSFPSKEDQLKLKGEVMWVTPEGEADERAGKPPGMGIRFLFQKEEEKQEVHDFVERLMSQALGEHISTKLLAKKLEGEP